MIVYVLEYYSNKGYHFDKGQVVELDPQIAEWLVADAPGCFSLDPDAALRASPPIVEKAPDEPPKDKAVKAAPKKKSASSRSK